MENITVNFTGITSKALLQETDRILKAGNEVRKNLYKVGVVLNKINDKELYATDFKNIVEYSKDVLGLSKAMTYHFLKIGKEFTNPETLQSNLPHDKEDFSVTQVIQMLPLKSYTDVSNFVIEQEITPEMTCVEIKKKVKEYLQPETEETETEETETEETENSEEQREVLDELRKSINDCLTVFKGVNSYEEVFNSMMDMIKSL